MENHIAKQRENQEKPVILLSDMTIKPPKKIEVKVEVEKDPTVKQENVD